MYTFSKKEAKPKEGSDIGLIVGKRSVKAQIGLEIEMEGNKFQKTGLPFPWKYVKDGSLRGQANAEYVLDQPLMFDDVPDAIDKLWQMLAGYGTVLSESNRTSVHVHLNAQRFHMNRLAAFCALYYSIEEILTEFCGSHRVGNLFCLRGKDAPATVSKLKTFITSNGNTNLNEGLHYAGLNIQSLQKFGSLEIRTMRGVTNPSLILKWVSILRRIYDLSGEYTDPRDICHYFSGHGPMAFLEHVLGEHLYDVKNGIDYTNDQIMTSVYDGIRLAQDVCYCQDWDLYKPVVYPDDPFGRLLKKRVSQAEVYEDSIHQSAASILNNMYLSQGSQTTQSNGSIFNVVTAYNNTTSPAMVPPAPTPSHLYDIENVWYDMPEAQNWESEP
jgi:hypothetical protein